MIDDASDDEIVAVVAWLSIENLIQLNLIIFLYIRESVAQPFYEADRCLIGKDVMYVLQSGLDVLKIFNCQSGVAIFGNAGYFVSNEPGLCPECRTSKIVINIFSFLTTRMTELFIMHPPQEFP